MLENYIHHIGTENYRSSECMYTSYLDLKLNIISRFTAYETVSQKYPLGYTVENSNIAHYKVQVKNKCELTIMLQ